LKLQIVRRSIIKEPISIYTYKKDLFFDTDPELWFHFKRDSLREVIGFDKKKHQFIDVKPKDVMIQINENVWL